MSSPLTFGIHVIRNQESFSALDAQAKTEDKRLVLVKYKNEYAVRVLPKQSLIARALSSIFGTTARQEKRLRDFAASLPRVEGTQRQVAQALGDLIKGEKDKHPLIERAGALQKEFGLDPNSVEVIASALQFHDDSIAEGNSVAALLTDAEAFSLYRYNTTDKEAILQAANEKDLSLIYPRTQKFLDHIRHAIGQLDALGLDAGIPLDPKEIQVIKKADPLIQELEAKLHSLGRADKALDLAPPDKPARAKALAEPERVALKEAQDVMTEAIELENQGEIEKAEEKALMAHQMSERCNFYNCGPHGKNTKSYSSTVARIIEKRAKAARARADVHREQGRQREAEAEMREGVKQIKRAAEYAERKNHTVIALFLMELAKVIRTNDLNNPEADALQNEAKGLLAVARSSLGIT